MREEVMSASTGMTDEQKASVAAALTEAVLARLSEHVAAVESKADQLVSELREFLSQSAARSEDGEEDEPEEDGASALSSAGADMAGLQQYLDVQFGRLDARFKNLGESFKNSQLFDFKNPFAQVVGKIASPFKELGDRVGSLVSGVSAGVS